MAGFDPTLEVIAPGGCAHHHPSGKRLVALASWHGRLPRLERGGIALLAFVARDRLRRLLAPAYSDPLSP